MLIVGTKGRSLDGVQGFLTNRSSFSKYCLQYSPVPVVVVRPTEKREKKKAKRAGDPGRQSYLQILAGNKHEADSESSSLFELEPKITADEEAHQVAAALGLPAAYDPTIKPVDPATLLRKGRKPISKDAAKETLAAAALKGRIPTEKAVTGEESESESEAEFEVESGQDIVKKERLHKMESNEGAALKAETSRDSLDSDDLDGPGGGGAKT